MTLATPPPPSGVRPELAQFADEIRAAVPPGTAVIDAHAHLGADEDGSRLVPDRLLAQMDALGVAAACVFPLHDPERRPAYRIPNDRVLDWAAASAGRLVPFCRLDPADGACAELERCLARGARGVKLHPRAEPLDGHGPELERVFALAAANRMPVLVHTGAGLREAGSALCEVALRHPDAPLILAHAGVGDMAMFAHRLAEHPAACFDTSVFGPLDLLELLARVPAERLVFGSDPPYGRMLLGLYATVRAARAAGASAAQLDGLLGGTARRLVDGQPLEAPAAPLRPRLLTMPGALARIAAHLMHAFRSVVRGAPDAADAVELARAVCRDPDPGPAEPALARLAPILATVAEHLADPGAKRSPAELIYLAMSLAVTEPIPLM